MWDVLYRGFTIEILKGFRDIETFVIFTTKIILGGNMNKMEAKRAVIKKFFKERLNFSGRV